jgi:sirohydrochlorin cobaltochelatase
MAHALLIVDHGTRNPEANASLAAFARRVAAARPEWRVAHAHMELGEPDVPTAIAALVAAGATEIHLHLHFLGRGVHVRETIPQLVEDARGRHEHVRFHVADPLGEDPRLLDIVLDRLDALGR